MNALLKRPQAAMGLKLAGLVLLLVPIGVLLLFTFGEGREGLQHLVQLAPLLAVAVLAWYRPRLGGTLLIVIGLALAVAFPFLVDFALGTTLGVIAIFFAPAILAGALFLLAGGMTGRPTGSQRSAPALQA